MYTLYLLNIHSIFLLPIHKITYLKILFLQTRQNTFLRFYATCTVYGILLLPYLYNNVTIKNANNNNFL